MATLVVGSRMSVNLRYLYNTGIFVAAVEERRDLLQLLVYVVEAVACDDNDAIDLFLEKSIVPLFEIITKAIFGVDLHSSLEWGVSKILSKPELAQWVSIGSDDMTFEVMN